MGIQQLRITLSELSLDSPRGPKGRVTPAKKGLLVSLHLFTSPCLATFYGKQGKGILNFLSFDVDFTAR